MATKNADEVSAAYDKKMRDQPGPKDGYWLPNENKRFETWRRPDGQLCSQKMPVKMLGMGKDAVPNPAYANRVATLEAKGLKRA